MYGKINENYAKKMRYIPSEDFDYGIRLDIKFDNIFSDIDGFRQLIIVDQSKSKIIGAGKPRFSAVAPSTHCDMPILSADYYLIGFCDCIGHHQESGIYKFVYEGLDHWDYIAESSRNLGDYKDLLIFHKDCLLIEQKHPKG